VLLCCASLPPDTEDDNQKNYDNHWQSKAKHQPKYQPQLWAVVDIAHVAKFLNKVPKPNLQQALIINNASWNSILNKLYFIQLLLLCPTDAFCTGCG